MKVVARKHTGTLLALTSGLLAAPGAYGLVRFNDGRDQIFVTLTAGATYDSNIYTANGGSGDTIFSSGLQLEYQRKAGLIGVNANAGWSFSKFGSYSGEDFTTPSMGLEFTKSTGRTTGSLTFHASQSNKPDINTNIRTQAWDYGTSLSLRYPVIERYSLAGNFGYSTTDYADNGGGLADSHVYTAGVDLYYTWTSERDLFFGYRHRYTDTSAGMNSTDHNISMGVSGKIYSKLNGSARVGIQSRTTQTPGGPDETYTGLSAAISTSWTVNRRFTLTGTIARDFNTTSTSSNTETTSFTIDGQYAVNAKLSLNGRVGYGINDYLDSGSGNRHDTYYTCGAGFSYIVNAHLTVRGSYDYFTNTSTSSLSEFDRHVFSLSLSSRW